MGVLLCCKKVQQPESQPIGIAIVGSRSTLGRFPLWNMVPSNWYTNIPEQLSGLRSSLHRSPTDVRRYLLKDVRLSCDVGRFLLAGLQLSRTINFKSEGYWAQ